MVKDQNTAPADDAAALDELIEKSKGTDIAFLLQAKELAKRNALKNPSSANLSALQRATAMLEDAQARTGLDEDAPVVFKTVGAVLRYLQEEKGRQIKQSKLYRDIKNGLLRKEKTTFRQVDVDRYAGSLPLSTTPDGRSNDAEERQRRKDEADIRIKEAQAYREEKKNKVIDGQYINREQVYQEFAARAVALNMGLKSAVQESALNMVRAVGGDQQKTELLVRELEKLIDAASNEYARELQFEVDLHAIDDGDDGSEQE